ncbi:MAG: carbohydrate-binding domain-containing protein [Coriobacteriales bacterium]|nr:carbohydrate-binding domain-containing protein [Coriobacteriales bacterium]
MHTRIRTILTLLMAALLALSALTACGAAGSPAPSEPATNAPTASSAASAPATTTPASTTTAQALELKDEDLDASWDATTATTITLSGTSATVEGAGAAAAGGIVTITTAGTYVLSGTLSDGSIEVAATQNDLVHLVLNGASITNTKGAAIYASQCDKLVLTLADGTHNSVTDGGAAFTYADAVEEEPNAALFVKDDLSINGTGALNVQATWNNGIQTKDDLLLVSGTLTVDAVHHALVGHDSVGAVGGTYELVAGAQGVRANKEADAAAGWIIIEGGSFNVTATDDALHATNDIKLLGGDLQLATGDDGIHSDTNLIISDGSVTVSESYEGLEAANIDIQGGSLDVISSDDGLNAAGGADASGTGGGFGGDPFAASGNYSITIGGGSIQLRSGGDGIDSNGPITISGGTIYSYIDSQANGAIDTDGSFAVTGGTLVYGGSDVGVVPTTGSTQSYVYVSGSFAKGSIVRVEKAGQLLIEATVTLDCPLLALSSPDIAAGGSYEVYSGDSLLATVTAGEGGGMGGMGGPGGGMGGGGHGGPGTGIPAGALPQ